MTGSYDEDELRPEEPVVVRDRRKIDPETGELRKESVQEEVPVGAAGPSASPPAGESTVDESVEPVSGLEKELAERTADLQRVQAEYTNYRKRVDRDRDAVIAGAKASIVSDLLPLMDDLERAEAHGDLTGAFKSVADKLVDALEKAGLSSFGAEGDAFDPSVHEAVQHNTSPDVPGPTVTTVLRRGYAFGDRTLRAALVGVTDHEPTAADAAPAPTQAPQAQQAQPGGDAQPVDAPVEGTLPIDPDENAR